MSGGTTTARAGRTGRDKPNKSMSHSPSKVEAQKNHPTAEQMRMAHIITEKHSTDPETEQKVKQVVELTGKSEDAVSIALHDCDGDPNKAANMLLEGEGDQGEWVTTEKKKKKHQTSGATEENAVNHKPDRREDKNKEHERDKDREPRERSEGSSRGGRMRSTMPPRLARGRGKENDDRADSHSRERSFERGRGRGRGQMNGPSRGRGRGGRRFERGGRFDKGSKTDDGPRIDTWTNETAEKKDKGENSSWDLHVEDWTNDDEWQGNLQETKVFTASSTAPETKLGYPPPGIGDNDASIFQPPPPNMNVETSMFSSTMASPPANGGMSLGSATPLDGSGPLPHSNVMGPGSSPGLGQSSHLGQRLGLGMLGLNDKSGGDAPVNSHTQQSQFMSQFAKQATESIKNAVGIGNSSPSNQSPMLTAPSQPPLSVGNALPAQQLQQRTKPQRTKLPPPSKIPASAVEMPGHMVGFPLDVQFGNWDLNNESSNVSYGNFGTAAEQANVGAGFPGAPVSSGTNLNSLSHVSKSDISPPVMTNVTSTKPSVTGLESLTQGSVPGQMSSVFSNSTPTSTPTKDFSQSSKMTPPDPIPFPNDRKSPYASQRQTQTPGSMGSSSSSSPSQMPAFSQPGYTSGYQSSSYKSTQNQYAAQNYQPSSFQNQGSYSSSQYPSSNSASSFPGQSGAYQNQTSVGYSRDSQSSYQGSVSQSASSYPSGGGQSTSSYPTGSGQSAAQFPSAGSQLGPSYPSGGSQSGNSYQTSNSGISQSASAFQNNGVQSNSSYHSGSQSSTFENSLNPAGTAIQNAVSQPASGSYQSDQQNRQSSFGSTASYGTANHQSSLSNSAMSTSKLSDNLAKMTVKDTTLDGQTPSQFDAGSTSTSSLTSTTTTASSSLPGTSVSVSATIGLSTAISATSSVITTSATTVSKSSSQATSKAPPGVPPGVPPLIGASYLMGQPGTMPFAAAAFAGLAQQPAMYGYEDLQLLQQRMPLPGYYDMPFQPQTTLARDQNTLSSVQYSGADGKLNRVEAQSPVQGQATAQPTAQQQTVSAHQQPFMNPQGLQAYSYYYPGAAGILPYSYTPAVFPMPSVTNPATHGVTQAATAQYQKANVNAFSHTYGTAYDELNQGGQDFTKTAYGAASQSQSKPATAPGGVASAADLTGAGYGKAHSGSFDKASFHNNTPPPFNLALPTVTQAGPMGAQPTAYTPYVPMMAQPHSQMLHHQLQHDSTGASNRASQPSSNAAKAGGTKNYSTGYWSTN